MVHNIAENILHAIKWLCNLVPKRQTLCTQGNLLQNKPKENNMKWYQKKVQPAYVSCQEMERYRLSRKGGVGAGSRGGGNG
jgi:hypothetical protein